MAPINDAETDPQNDYRQHAGRTPTLMERDAIERDRILYGPMVEMNMGRNKPVKNVEPTRTGKFRFTHDGLDREMSVSDIYIEGDFNLNSHFNHGKNYKGTPMFEHTGEFTIEYKQFSDHSIMLARVRDKRSGLLEVIDKNADETMVTVYPGVQLSQYSSTTDPMKYTFKFVSAEYHGDGVTDLSVSIMKNEDIKESAIANPGSTHEKVIASAVLDKVKEI